MNSASGRPRPSTSRTGFGIVVVAGADAEDPGAKLACPASARTHAESLRRPLPRTRRRAPGSPAPAARPDPRWRRCWRSGGCTAAAPCRNARSRASSAGSSSRMATGTTELIGELASHFSASLPQSLAVSPASRTSPEPRRRRSRRLRPSARFRHTRGDAPAPWPAPARARRPRRPRARPAPPAPRASPGPDARLGCGSGDGRARRSRKRRLGHPDHRSLIIAQPTPPVEGGCGRGIRINFFTTVRFA